MSPEQITGLSLTLLLMCVGLLGSVLPMLPGPPIIFAAAIVHRLYFGEASASNLVLLMLTGAMVFALLIDYLATSIGARKLGATWRGVVGAVAGGLAGLFFGLPGIVAGPFIGALLLELAGGRELGPAAKAGVGAVLGLVAAAIVRVACCVAMMILFAFDVIVRSQPEPQPVETVVAHQTHRRHETQGMFLAFGINPCGAFGGLRSASFAQDAGASNWLMTPPGL
jgi:uncharacterized protein YqgC (DUF456 family)